MTSKPAYSARHTASFLVMGLSALYLLFSVGILKATHSCMGREASVVYFTSEPKKCACSLFAKGDDECCDDTRGLLKLDLSQKNLTSFQLALPVLTIVGDLSPQISDIRNESPAAFPAHADDAQPPPKALYKVYCSFVFYDMRRIA